MYRLLFKNKDTGQEEMLWSGYVNKEKKYFKDLCLTQEVDISNYEEVKVKKNIGDIPYPYQLFGVECDKGWYPLIQPVIDYIDDFNKGKSEDEMIYIHQIKEKYGTLRIYVSHFTPELGELIDKAEEESCHVCEFCGSRKHVGSTLGWLMTICHDCVKKMCQERDNSVKWHSYDDDNIYWINPDKDDELVESNKEYQESLL